MKLLGRLSSINVRKVVWAAEEAGLPYVREDWGTGFRSTQSPEFRAINNKGLVPVLIDDDMTLTESNSIMRYIAGKSGRDDLFPRSLQAEAHVNEWLDWQASELNPAWSYAVMGLVRQSPDHQDPEAIKASLARWHKQMLFLDHELAKRSAFLTGETFTIADIAVGLSINRWLQMPVEQPVLSSVQAYFSRLSVWPTGQSLIGPGTF